MVIVMYFIGEHELPDEERPLFNMDTCFFSVMTIYVFGFTCHQNVRLLGFILFGRSLRLDFLHLQRTEGPYDQAHQQRCWVVHQHRFHHLPCHRYSWIPSVW